MSNYHLENLRPTAPEPEQNVRIRFPILRHSPQQNGCPHLKLILFRVRALFSIMKHPLRRDGGRQFAALVLSVLLFAALHCGEDRVSQRAG
jgi:hypothetical protein